MRLAYPALTLLITLAAAGDIDANDLPSECKEVCSSVVSLTASCDSKTSDDDTAELSCICKGKNAASILPMCDACITKYSKDGSDNDANDLVRSCSFTTTSFKPGATAMASTDSVSVTTTEARASTSTAETAASSGASESPSSTSALASPSNAAIGGVPQPALGAVGSLAAAIFFCLIV